MGTDHTTTSATATPQHLDPRRILALIALADNLPMPRSIAFIKRVSVLGDVRPILSLPMHTLGDASRWATWMGATTTHTYAGKDGRTYFNHSAITWHGWSIQIDSSEDGTPDTPLDVATRDRLEQVADVTPTGGSA